jgi:hypothetical protein
MLDNVIRLSLPRRMPPVSPLLDRADWLDARLDALPRIDGVWQTDRVAALDQLGDDLCALPDMPDYWTDASPWGALHSLTMLGLSVHCEESFEAMCRAWVRKARGGR